MEEILMLMEAVGFAYRDIVARYPNAPGMDRVENIYYNGRQTIADKTQYVVENGFPGVMIWESHTIRMIR